MRTGFIAILVLFVSLWFIAPVFAEASFKNDVDILGNSINLAIKDEYSGIDASSFREDLDLDGDGYVKTDEVEEFRNVFLDNKSKHFLGYIEVDGNETSVDIASVDIQLENAEGKVDDSALYVKTYVVYDVDAMLSEGSHTVWVLGHPLIEDARITLPEGMDVVSYDGIANASQMTEGGRMVLKGSSGIRSFMVEDQPTFEYAFFIEFAKMPFYKKPFFIPLLVLLELILALAGLYIIKKNKIK